MRNSYCGDAAFAHTDPPHNLNCQLLPLRPRSIHELCWCPLPLPLIDGQGHPIYKDIVWGHALRWRGVPQKVQAKPICIMDTKKSQNLHFSAYHMYLLSYDYE